MITTHWLPSQKVEVTISEKTRDRFKYLEFYFFKTCAPISTSLWPQITSEIG